jgi:acyl phosphate:glycerol-3-phosphate acyltransferase
VILVAIVAAYLIGSFPSGVVVSRLVLGRDIRGAGSGNIGAANAARVGGFKVGAAVGVLDVLKGIVAVLLTYLLNLDPVGVALVAVTAVLGHDFSLFLGLRGGKGVATTFGVMLAISPLGTLIAAALWLVILLTTGYSSLGSLLALAILPLTLAVAGQPGVVVAAAFGLFLVAVIKHRQNVARLLAGTESSFKRRHPDGA